MVLITATSHRTLYSVYRCDVWALVLCGDSHTPLAWPTRPTIINANQLEMWRSTNPIYNIQYTTQLLRYLAMKSGPSCWLKSPQPISFPWQDDSPVQCSPSVPVWEEGGQWLSDSVTHNDKYLHWVELQSLLTDQNIPRGRGDFSRSFSLLQLREHFREKIKLKIQSGNTRTSDYWLQ